MKAVVATRLGGPEVLEHREVLEPEVGPDQVLLSVSSAGVNFADTLATRGLYAAAPPPPFVPGLEVAGRDPSGRPVLALLRAGGYAERVAADRRLVFDAGNLDLELAGGWLLVTLTAYIGLREMARLRPGETVLVSAGAGGLGTATAQVARSLGAGGVVAIASTPAKRAFALENGADQAVGYEDPLPPVDVVVDGVGGNTFRRCLEAVRPLGRLLLLGASSGVSPELPGFDVLRRRNLGILCFSLGMLRSGDPELVGKMAPEAVGLLRSGAVRPPLGRVLALEEAAQAHAMLAGRRSLGKLLLRP